MELVESRWKTVACGALLIAFGVFLFFVTLRGEVLRKFEAVFAFGVGVLCVFIPLRRAPMRIRVGDDGLAIDGTLYLWDQVKLRREYECEDGKVNAPVVHIEVPGRSIRLTSWYWPELQALHSAIIQRTRK